MTKQRSLAVGGQFTILPSTPDIRSPSEAKYKTEGMKLLDLVLSRTASTTNIGNDLMEKIVHEFHMREVLAQVGSIFCPFFHIAIPKPLAPK